MISDISSLLADHELQCVVSGVWLELVHVAGVWGIIKDGSNRGTIQRVGDSIPFVGRSILGPVAELVAGADGTISITPVGWALTVISGKN